MKKLVGYLIAVVGLLVLIVGIARDAIGVPALLTINEMIFYGVGVVLIIVGVVLSMMNKESSGIEHATPEVPIYKGKKIVGYRKAED